MAGTSRDRKTECLALACALFVAGCFRNERSYPFLDDARSARRTGDFERAHGAANAVLENTSTLAASTAEVDEARGIAKESLEAIADQRLRAARSLPSTQEGLVARLGQLVPVLSSSALASYHERARTEIADTLLPLWQKGEPSITKENYAVALDALQRHRAFIPKEHALVGRADAIRVAMSREHETRAASAVDGELGLASRRYHLARAVVLGADHKAEVARLDEALRRAIGVSYVVTKVDAPSTCESHRSVVSSTLASPGKHPIDLAITIRACDVSRSVTTSTKTRSYRVPIATKKMAEVPVFDGYTSATQTRVKDHYCWGNVAAGGKTCSTTTQTSTEQIPQYHYELQEVVDTTYETRETKFPVRTKTKRAAFRVEVTASVDGDVKSFSADGAEDFEDVEVAGDSGGQNRSFGREPSDGEMIVAARGKAMAKAVSFVRGLGPRRLAIALDEYERSSTGDPLREEAAHAAVVWALQSGPRYERSRAWLGQRWGERAPEGELATMVAAFKAPFSEVALGSYAHEKPGPPSYLHVAQGVGYLVTTGLSFEATVKQAALDADRSHVLGSASYALGDGEHALRLGASGASSSIAGDAYGFGFGALYARSLRGEVDEKRRVEVIASAGVAGGASRVDGGLVDSPLKERFVRVPVALTVGAPFYLVALQASVVFEPNLFALAQDDAWKALHPLSGWFGVSPVPWVVVDGGVELPFGADSLTPRFGGRVGLRL